MWEIRLNVDIPVDTNGIVHSKTGGMSVSPSPDDLPTHQKSPEFGGTGKDPVWGINAADYQKTLANTNINWEKV